MRKEGLLGVFINTYSSRLPVEGLGGGDFKEVITQYSELLNPQDWDYSEFDMYIPKDIVIEKSLLYDLQDLKTIYGHLVKEAHKQMDYLSQNMVLFEKDLPYLPDPRMIEIEVEGKRLEMNWLLLTQNEISRCRYLRNILDNLSEEIKSEGKVGVLFYSKEAPNWRRSVLRIE